MAGGKVPVSYLNVDHGYGGSECGGCETDNAARNPYVLHFYANSVTSSCGGGRAQMRFVT